MSLPSNAVLTAVKRPGGLKGNGDPGAPVAVWQGRARAYLMRDERFDVRDGREVRVQVDVLVIPARLVPDGLQAGADWESSTITVEDRRPRRSTIATFRVTGADLKAAGTTVDSMRLELEAL